MEKKLDKREELLKLDKDRKKLEEKIAELTEYLTQPGMPGIDGSLLDKEGFPKAGLDLVSIRTARHDLICTQNDLKNLMEIIEKKMAIYFEELNSNKTEQEEIKEEEEPKEKLNTKKTETTAGAVGEDPKINSNKNDVDIKEPFAKILTIEKGSPAEEAGLKQDDAIINFNGILYKGVSYNPLVTLSEIVKSKIGEKIPMSIVRKNNENLLEVVNLDIIPHTWNGKGVLGCKFQIIS